MKKTAFFFIAVIVLCFALSLCVCADIVTTASSAAQTTAQTSDGYEPDMVRGINISAPIAISFCIVCAFIVYGAVKLRKQR